MKRMVPARLTANAWKAEELAILEANINSRSDVIAEILRKNGYLRSRCAVSDKRKKVRPELCYHTEDLRAQRIANLRAHGLRSQGWPSMAPPLSERDGTFVGAVLSLAVSLRLITRAEEGRAIRNYRMWSAAHDWRDAA